MTSEDSRTSEDSEQETSPNRRSRKPAVITALVVLALVGGVALWAFQPWTAFIDNVVDEAVPTMTDDAEAAGVRSSTSTSEFIRKDKDTEGTARIITLEDGQRILRLEDFTTSNGPDLFVYLSPAGVDAEGGAFAEGAVNLGDLKGNVGNQNYDIPSDVDLTEFNSVVIYCLRFTSPFGAAPVPS